MSLKRVILLTKDRCLPSKSNQFYENNALKGLNNNNNEQFNSFNLNKNDKSGNIKFEQSKYTPFSKKSQNNNGFFDYKNDSKKALNDWKKNDTPNFHESLKIQKMKNEYKLETKVKKDCNKSNLSLHIEAYENLIKTKNVTFARKASFDFLKQQDKELMHAEIMQFKTSQKLLNFQYYCKINIISSMIPSSTSKLGNVRHFSTTLKSLRSVVGGSHHQECTAFPIAPIVPQKFYRSNNVINGKILPLYCPTAQRPVKVYSFPTPNKVIIEAPTILSLLIEKVEPLTSIVPVVDPNQSNKLPMIAGPRMLTIRRKKMKKHKRRKRFDRDWFKYQKHHRQKKMKAEKVFRARMNDLMKTLETFDPMEYVTDTIKRAKREWSTDLTPSGKKNYPHWSKLMTLEELYNIEKSDYIDKRAGLPNEEDAQQIAQLRQKYDLQYSRKTKVDGKE